MTLMKFSQCSRKLNEFYMNGIYLKFLIKKIFIALYWAQIFAVKSSKGNKMLVQI